MKKLILGILVSLFIGSVAVASPLGVSGYPDKLMAALALIDRVPTAAQLVEAGADPDGAVLISMARDTRLSGYTRLRAASLLGQFKTSEVAKRGVELLIQDDDAVQTEVRVQAIYALAHLKGAEAQSHLEPLLRSPNQRVREGVVRALAQIKAYDVLEQRLRPDGERAPQLRTLIQHKLANR